MCLGSGSMNRPAPPASAPPPPVDGATSPELNETRASEQNLLNAGRMGRGSLRINRAVGGGGDRLTGAGLNVTGV